MHKRRKRLNHKRRKQDTKTRSTMKILFLASEVAPLAKTGGLADVAGSLPQAMQKKGVDIALCMPKYQTIDIDAELIDTLEIDFPKATYKGRIFKSTLPDSTIPIFFIEQNQFFLRDGLYNEAGKDYPDNLLRFCFFSRACLEVIRRGHYSADIIHANDWQTAMAPVYLKSLYADVEELARVRSLFTIHNLAYQGSYEVDKFPMTGLDWNFFRLDGLEFYNRVNLMKGGILLSDHVSTVSPSYADEIQTPEFGCGLDGILRMKSEHLTGVLNGADYSQWSPEHDKYLPATYDINTVETNKSLCKKALLEEFGLPADANKPVFGVVSRLASQKGLDLLAEAVPKLIKRGAQFVILGTGEPHIEDSYRALNTIHPNACGVKISYNERISHLIQAGSDLFIVPSRYEPCGLTQMYALRFGAIPIVRHTGGLADTIKDVNSYPDGNGFVFYDPSSIALQEACIRALTLYENKHVWWSIVKRAMKQDFSWDNSAHEYIKLYLKILGSST